MAITNYIYERATGNGAIAEAFTPDVPFVLVTIKVNLNAASGIAEDFTVSVDSSFGAVYDFLLFSQSMLSAIDVLWQPVRPVSFAHGDVIELAYANSAGRTWALEFIYRQAI